MWSMLHVYKAIGEPHAAWRSSTSSANPPTQGGSESSPSAILTRVTRDNPDGQHTAVCTAIVTAGVPGHGEGNCYSGHPSGWARALLRSDDGRRGGEHCCIEGATAPRAHCWYPGTKDHSRRVSSGSCSRLFLPQQTGISSTDPMKPSPAATRKAAKLFARKAKLNPALLDRYKKPVEKKED